MVYIDLKKKSDMVFHSSNWLAHVISFLENVYNSRWKISKVIAFFTSFNCPIFPIINRYPCHPHRILISIINSKMNACVSVCVQWRPAFYYILSHEFKWLFNNIFAHLCTSSAFSLIKTSICANFPLYFPN